MEHLLFHKVKGAFGKLVVYTYNKTRKGVYRRGYNVLENNDFISGKGSSFKNGKYSFTFLPSEEYTRGEGRHYQCNECQDLENGCLNCQYKDFVANLSAQLNEYKLWIDPSYDDHKCILHCNKLAIDFDKKRDPSDKNTLLCKHHINKDLCKTPKEYIEDKRSYYVTKYEEIMRFLGNPLPDETELLRDSENNVVKARLGTVG